MSDAPLTVQALLRDARDRVKHDQYECDFPDFPCTCKDRAERVLAAQARVVEAFAREIAKPTTSIIIEIDEDGKVHDPTFDAALAAGRAALEEETR